MSDPGGDRGLRAALRGRLGRGMRRSRARQVLALLEEERELIRRGDLAALAGLAPRCQAALEDLSASPVGTDDEAQRELNALRGAAQRNRRLLAAMLQGAAEAQRELAAIESAGRRLGYGRDGGALTSSGDVHSKPRRA